MIISSLDKITTLPVPALGLLPAVHDAAAESYAGGALPAVAAGSVLVNADTEAVQLPAYGPWPAQMLAVGEYAACDGRFWYPAVRYGTTNSYYPRCFERTLYTLAFTAESLPVGAVFRLKRRFALRLLSNNTDAVWNVVWEVGMRTDDTTPDPVGPNIASYAWRTPLIDQQVHVTDVAGGHDFGVTLRRDLVSAVETWSGDVTRYSKVLGAVAAQLPTGNAFVLRLRLSCFDVLNAPTEPRGYAAYFCSEGK